MALLAGGWDQLDNADPDENWNDKRWYHLSRSVLLDIEEVVSNCRTAICVILHSDGRLSSVGDHANIASLTAYVIEAIRCFASFGYPDHNNANGFYNLMHDIERASDKEITFEAARD